jgi:hypothetical protein
MWTVGLGKAFGLAYGLVWFFTVPLVAPDADPLLRWGILGWIITLSALISMAVLAQPRFSKPFVSIPAWIFSAALGAWMGVLIMLVAHELVARYTAYFWPEFLFMPWLLVVETAIVGVIIGWASRRAFNPAA